MNLFQQLKKALSGRANKKTLKYLEVAPSVNMGGMQIICRVPMQDRKYLRIEDHCVVQGKFVFESSGGLISVGENTFIGSSTFICINKIIVGRDVLISWGCTIIDNDAHSIDWELRRNDVRDWKKGLEENSPGKYKNWKDVNSAPVVIGDRSWIGFNCIILKGVSIGEGSIIGAGSVVTTDIPPNVIAAGNPARIIKAIES